jgi:hypothetical protein
VTLAYTVLGVRAAWLTAVVAARFEYSLHVTSRSTVMDSIYFMHDMVAL